MKEMAIKWNLAGRYVLDRAANCWELFDTQDQRRYGTNDGLLEFEIVYPSLDDAPDGDMLCPQVDYAHGYVVITSLMPLALPGGEILDPLSFGEVPRFRCRLPIDCFTERRDVL